MVPRANISVPSLNASTQAYLIFVTHATHGVSVKMLKWGELFPYWTQTESLCKFVHSVQFYIQYVILYTVCNFTQLYNFTQVYNFTHCL